MSFSWDSLQVDSSPWFPVPAATLVPLQAWWTELCVSRAAPWLQYQSAWSSSPLTPNSHFQSTRFGNIPASKVWGHHLSTLLPWILTLVHFASDPSVCFSGIQLLPFFLDHTQLLLVNIVQMLDARLTFRTLLGPDAQQPTAWSLLRSYSPLHFDSGWSKGDRSVAGHGCPGLPPVGRLGIDLPTAPCPLHQKDLICPSQHKGISCASITALFSCLDWRENRGEGEKKTGVSLWGLYSWLLWVPFPDCASSLLCLRCPVLQPDRPSFWEIPSTASWALDVRSSAYLFQVCFLGDAVSFM